MNNDDNVDAVLLMSRTVDRTKWHTYIYMYKCWLHILYKDL